MSEYKRVFGRCNHVRPLPTLEVDLDLSPSLRWSGIRSVVDPKEVVSNARRYVDETCSTYGLPRVATSAGGFWLSVGRWLMFAVMGIICRVFSRYAADLSAVAKEYEISLGELFIANLLYELLGGCTSFVVSSGPSQLLHGRTLDWPFIPLAKHTCTIVWKRNGTVLYQSVGWPGYVGVMTGVKPGAFSISLNARYPDAVPAAWSRLVAQRFYHQQPPEVVDVMALLVTSASRRMWAALLGGGQAANIIRHAFEHADTYDEAVQILSNSPIAVPSYFIVAAGAPPLVHKQLPAAIIRRGLSNSDVHIDRLVNVTRNPKLVPFLVQTNDDHPIQGKRFDAEAEADADAAAASGAPVDFNSIERFKNACNCLADRGSDARSKEALAKLMCTSVKQGGVRMSMSLYMCILDPTETTDMAKSLVACRASKAVGPR